MLGKNVLKDEILLKQLQQAGNYLEEAYRSLNKMKFEEIVQQNDEAMEPLTKFLSQLKEFSQFTWEWSDGKVDMEI